MRLNVSGAFLGEFALIVAALLLYVFTLDNGLQPYELRGGDLITHHYAQVEARFANAPGYPLYSLGGWLWFHALHTLVNAFSAAPPNPIPILSAYSLIWALIALWLLYRLILLYTRSQRRPAGNWPIAWLLSAFFAVTYFFWYYATTSEQYSSAIAQTLAILYVYEIWRARNPDAAGTATAPRTRAQTSGNHGWLYLLAFLCGISLAHMLTVAFIVPPLVALLLWQAPHLLRSASVVIGALVAAGLPLLSYLFVYVRGAQYRAWRGEGDWPTTAAWFWEFIGTAQGRDELSWGFQPGAPFFGNGFPELIWQEMSVPLLILGLAGIALLPRRTMLLIYATLAIYLAFCWAYRLGNWFQVILPAYPLIIIGAAMLAHRLEEYLRHIRPSVHSTPRAFPGRVTWTSALIILPLVIALVWRVQASWPDANSRNRPQDTGLDRAAILIDQPLPAQGNLFASVDDALALDYLARVWRIRPDLSIIGSDQAARALIDGRPVLATWDSAPLLLTELALDAPVLAHAYSPDWFLLTMPATDAQASVPASLSVAPGLSDDVVVVEDELHNSITLLGYLRQPAPSGAPVLADIAPGVDLILFWQIGETGWDEGAQISVRPLQGDGYFPPRNPTTSADEFVKVDRARPAPLMLVTDQHDDTPISIYPLVLGDVAKDHVQSAAGKLIIADPYRLLLPDEQNRELNGFELILYRAQDGHFENLAVARYPLQHPESP